LATTRPSPTASSGSQSWRCALRHSLPVPGADVDRQLCSKFLPVLVTSGSLILKGSVISADGEAMFSHAVQGMQPNLIARRWNFAFFTSPAGAEKRTRAIMMEFETNVCPSSF
jgi:hypothetical protein